VGENQRPDRDQTSQPGNRVNVARLKRTVALRFVLFPVVLGLMFFWPAGTFRYWQAWTYMAILLVPMLFIIVDLLKKDPELLESRIRTREKERRQKTIVILASLFFVSAYLLPGFDRRYGWSSVPVFVVVVADILVLAGYGLFVRVLKENRYASRVVEVTERQQVITTGPYTLVRHPMYLAIAVMFVLSPLALGSYWGMLSGFLLIFVLTARIRNEEKVLLAELPGYREYVGRVRYRLIPGIW
jgi:protein-S-isoprenylcysteine O-methyltransferase Ste14